MTFFEEAVISGFIGEAVSRCVDVSWTKIKEEVKNRNSKHQNIESQIYNILVGVLSQITDIKYKDNQDKMYQATEKLLLGFKDEKCNNLEAVKSGLQILGESINNDKYKEFMILLYRELSKNEYAELYRQIRLLQQDNESNKASNIEQKVDKVQQSVDETNRRLNAFQDNSRRIDNAQNMEPVKSRTKEYAEKWNANLFLNDFDEWDENAGVNIKLCDVYIDTQLPHFVWGNNKNTSDNLKDLLSKYIVEKCENKMLLILGQPGIGKSTLITWITANFADRLDDILVYKFASDLKNIDWNKGRVTNRILEELNLSINELNGKTLILDGFDEVNIGNSRRQLLDDLYGDWIYQYNIRNFSLIITCRVNYIEGFERIKCAYVILQPWDTVQIQSFCDIFQIKSKDNIDESTREKLIKNSAILGIPLILYMVLALGISIEQESSVIDVYDKIFSLEGGIYDRCIDNKSFSDKHRIGEIKKQVHQISREIAIWMFENNPADAYIPKCEYQNICNSVIQNESIEYENIQKDVLIGNYFKLVKHCEGIESEELYFIHRSIYEYFVVETICGAIEIAMKEFTDESQEELAGNIAIYLKQGEIDHTIGEYLGYKILKMYDKLEMKRRELFYEWWEKAIEKMMKFGMFYHTKMISNYTNIFAKETQCFKNVIEILRLIFHTSRKNYILEDVDQVLLMRYIKHLLVECRVLYIDNMEIDNEEQACEGFILDLSKMNLEKAYLERCNLSAVDLSETNLKYSILRHANLESAKLEGADLTGADLKNANLDCANLVRANLTEANLEGANLENIIFDERQIPLLESYVDLRNIKSYTEEKNNVINHEKFNNNLFGIFL